MIRFVQQDYARLRSYFDGYSLGSTLAVEAREDVVKRIHKQMLAALQVWANLEALIAAEKLTLAGVSIEKDSQQAAAIGEFFSDALAAAFASFHGLYKPAFMSLRSGIETFVRGGAGLASIEARTTTKVFRLFEIAEGQALFSGDAALAFQRLQQQYSDLCLYTHSATPAHMSKTFALANFPKHDTAALEGFAVRLEVTVVAVLSILVQSNADIYLAVPAKARDLLDEVVPATVRIKALGLSA